MRRVSKPFVLFALLCAGAGVASVAACARDQAPAGGTVVIGSASEPDRLLPPLYQTTPQRAASELLFDGLAAMGAGLNTVGEAGFEPRLAQRWSWAKDSLSIAFEIDPRALWHDGTPVRAADVAFAFSVYADSLVGSPRRGDLRNALDSVTVRDSITAVAWFSHRSAEQFYTVVASLVPLPQHTLGKISRDSLGASTAARAPVGSGPFVFASAAAGQLDLVANERYYRGRPALDHLVFTVVNQVTTALAKVYGGDVDFYDNFPPQEVAALATHPDLRLIEQPSFSYNFLQFNLMDGASDRPHPVFGDRATRRALAMALDRRAMAQNVFGAVGVAAIAPVSRAQWSFDSTVTRIPFDVAAAARTLDSLGWTLGADSVRHRGSHTLSFALLVPSVSKSRGSYAVLIQEQLRRVGAKVDVQSVEPGAFQAQMGSHQFDALIGGWGVTPSPTGIAQTWRGAPRTGSFNNAGGYSNPRFAAYVDSAMAASSMVAAKAHYRAAYETIIADAPAVWLYEAPNLLVASAHLVTGPMRADAWWTSVPAWRLRAAAKARATAAPKAP